MRVSRRTLLAGAAASLVTTRAFGDAGPRPRPAPGREQTVESLDAILARSGLRASTGFVLADLDSGAVIEALAPDVPRPPASVQKLVTALYARETLGADYRFATRLLATGPVESGRLRGDLVLAGDGSPVLDTDALGSMAAALRIGGVSAVEGRLLVAEGAMPVTEEIDASQPAGSAYNPGLSGINLNFNRVFAGWRAAGAGLTFKAPGERFVVEVSGIRGRITDASLPDRALTGDAEVWSLPRAGMRRAGSVWLPVARPARYAGEVFRAIAGQRGLVLPPAEVVDTTPAGTLVGLSLSQPLEIVLRDMLRFSTNLTAEIVGLRASQSLGLAPASLAASAGAMAHWAEGLGLEPAHLVNHSGLSGAARVTPAALARFLRAADRTPLPELMTPRAVGDADGGPASGSGSVAARVKTGTLDYASGLAGYLYGRRRLVFAILVADLDRRVTSAGRRVDPVASAAWTARARRQEQALLDRWALLQTL